jgi:hypothetical protein
MLLQAENPEGCTECFCYGITDSCDAVDYGVEILDHQARDRDNSSQKFCITIISNIMFWVTS